MRGLCSLADAWPMPKKGKEGNKNRKSRKERGKGKEEK
jgi:hypothetical protein